MKSVLENYGIEFSKILNLMFEENDKKFSLSEVVSLAKNTLIAVVFKFDQNNGEPKFNTNISEVKITNLLNKHTSSVIFNRIIKIYERDTIIIIKPNQHRYWLSLIAYRDADKCFIDFSNSGY